MEYKVRLKRRIITLFIPLLFLFLWIEEGKAEKREMIKLERVRVGSPSARTPTFLPFELGIKKGIYRKEGLEPEFFELKTSIATAGLRSGELDFSGSVPDSIRAAAAGYPFKLIFVITQRLPHFLVVKPDIRSVKELKGKVVAVGTVGSTVSIAVQEIFEHYGMNPERDLTLISTGPKLQVAALLSGSADAATLPPPDNILARKKGFVELLAVGDIVKTPSIGLTTTDRHLKERREIARRMLRGTLRGMNYVRDNKTEASEYMVKSWGVDKEMSSEILELELKTWTRYGLVSDEMIQRPIELGRKMGMIIRKDILPSQVADFSLLKEVQQELGLKD